MNAKGGEWLKGVWYESRAGGVVLIVACLLVWEGVAAFELVESVAFPPFSQVLTTWARALFSGELLGELVPSLRRLGFGYLLATVFGVGIGVLMGYCRPIYNLLEPITEVLRPIPSPAYIPIVILFFGIDDEMKVFMVMFASFFPVLINTYSGVRNVDITFIDTARTLGLSQGSIVFKVVIPASSPYIFAGLRISLAVSLILTVISEMVAGGTGIGYFILNMQRSFRVPEMYAGIVTLGLTGYLLNRLFLLVERRVIGWSEGYTATE